jgi:hypothetical protein
MERMEMGDNYIAMGLFLCRISENLFTVCQLHACAFLRTQGVDLKMLIKQMDVDFVTQVP